MKVLKYNVEDKGDFYKFELKIKTKSFFLINNLNYEAQDYHLVPVYKNPEKNDYAVQRYVFNGDRFWTKLDDGVYEFSEYFTKNIVVKACLAYLKQLLKDRDKNKEDYSFESEFTRTIRSLQQHWD